MTTQEILGFSLTAAGIFLTLGGSIIGVYVRFSVAISSLRQENGFLKQQVNELKEDHKIHTSEFAEWGEKLSTQIHELRLLIEQNKK
ncbi:MAG: hypothetical protein JWO03_2863 [Bacteroidetes bacterium]|nr:hypothetical protein [Bacteroidota bacterium]